MFKHNIAINTNQLQATMWPSSLALKSYRFLIEIDLDNGLNTNYVQVITS